MGAGNQPCKEQFKFNGSVEEHLEEAKKELGKLPSGLLGFHIRCHHHSPLLHCSSSRFHPLPLYCLLHFATGLVELSLIIRVRGELVLHVRLHNRPAKIRTVRDLYVLLTQCYRLHTFVKVGGGALDYLLSLLSVGGNQGSRPLATRLQMVGPCYRCGELGHLVANCPKPILFSSLW